MFPLRSSLVFSLLWATTAAFFLNDKNNAVYFFNGETNKDTWSNAQTVCNLLGADLLPVSADDDRSFLVDLKQQQLWTGIRSDPNDVTKFIRPDGSPFEGKVSGTICESTECCALFLQNTILKSDECDSKKAYVCKFLESFTELKPKFDMIDSIKSQLENFHQTMDGFNLKFVSIEGGQSKLDLKLQSYNSTLSADISKTIRLAEDVDKMAKDLDNKHKEIIEGTATKFNRAGRASQLQAGHPEERAGIQV